MKLIYYVLKDTELGWKQKGFIRINMSIGRHKAPVVRFQQINAIFVRILNFTFASPVTRGS